MPLLRFEAREDLGYGCRVQSAQENQVWTTKRLLEWMTEAFERRGIDSPRLSAEILLSHVLGCQRLRLYMEADRPAAPEERERLRSLVSRALTHEPIQYLTGEGWFFGLAFEVDRRVLIPRPSTETIVEHLLQHQRSSQWGGKGGDGLVIADVCTGSGCIAIALATRLVAARFLATDVSPGALEVARVNAARHGVKDRIEWVQGDLLDPLRKWISVNRPDGVDAIVSNPPYIPDCEWADVAPNVRGHEPESALRGGADGLTFVRRIIAEAPEMLRPGGLLFVEVAASTADSACDLAMESKGLCDVRVLRDVDNLPRVVAARRG